MMVKRVDRCAGRSYQRSTDTLDALTRAKRGEEIKAKRCETPIAAQYQLGRDVGADTRRGGSGEGVDARRRETVAEERELAVLGPEVVAPLADAVGLVDRDEPDTPLLQRAAERGVTTAAIGSIVRVATSGDFDPMVARLNLDNRQVYIKVRMPDALRQDVATFENLRVTARGGARTSWCPTAKAEGFRGRSFPQASAGAAQPHNTRR